MENLGHNSKTVPRVYAKRAPIKFPAEGEYEQKSSEKVEPAT